MLLRLVLGELKQYRMQIVLICVLQFIQTLATLYLPTLNADIIDNGVVKGDIAYIWNEGGIMLVATGIQVVCSIGAAYFGAHTAMAVGRNLRREIFVSVQSYSSREIGSFGAPTLITRSTNDVQQVQMLVLMTFMLLVSAPIMCIGGIIMALRQDAVLSWLLVIIVPLIAAVIFLLVRNLVPLFRRAQKQLDKINDVLREQIMGINVVRAFVKREHERRRFAITNRNLTGTQLSTARIFTLMFPAIMIIVNLASVAVMWFGALRIDNGDMQIGALTAFLTYIIQIMMAVMMAMFMFMMIPRAAICAERICEVLDTKTSVVMDDEVPTVALKGNVRFHDVDFSYPGAEEPVLSDVSLSTAPGRTTAIIGSTGSGKTTLLRLIPRLMDATSGTVTIDGLPLTSLGSESLRRAIGYVPQKPYLFAGTIASNLRYGDPDATDDDLWRALEIAQAADFVRAFPDGLESPVTQGGINVSGGQRQRLSIARAIVHRPSIYLFDESFSALDFRTDARLRAALRPHTRDAAVVIVAQRVNTIMGADEIIVLDQGRVVGRGVHHDLLESCETYQEIVTSQLTAEEAA
ncbi:ABC transporter ATP-binding protein [Spelaeicoccus albus]|uniref:ATP-binding cassette subfamily B protein n=1 Tax=Spelaeicoccus albus TaxID=1280376 RepID=A0A7Z0D4W9_9MICO|nr:ABC transporter ATP-binding protein [Spelaeicoccus albus]NYI68940.1 ATP-binding cassette subfamily B protein [Spelaeicoccus albus]